MNESWISRSLSSQLMFELREYGYNGSMKIERGAVYVVVCALIGIATLVLFLSISNISESMAQFLKYVYGKGCCYFCNRRRQRAYERARYEEMYGRIIRGRNPRNSTDTEMEFDEENEEDVATDEEEMSEEMIDPLPDDIQDPLDPDASTINVPISLSLVVIGLYVFIGSGLFAVWNDQSFESATYFIFSTFSTSGFIDLMASCEQANAISLAVSLFYIVFGLVVISMACNLMVEELIGKMRELARMFGIIHEEE